MSTAPLYLIRDEDPPPYDGARPKRHRTMIEDWLVDEIGSSLGVSALGLYAYLERRVNTSATCHVSYSRIADDLKLSRRHAIRMVKGLQQAGYIEVSVDPKARTDRKANTITLPHHTVRTPSDRTSDVPSDTTSDRPSARVSPQVVPSSTQVNTSSVTDQKAQTESKPLPANGPSQQIVKAFCEAVGIEKPTAYRKMVGQASQLAKAGYTPDDIPRMVTWLYADPFWKDKGIDLGVVLSQADKWRTSQPKAEGAWLSQAELKQHRYTDWKRGVYADDHSGYQQFMADWKADTLPQLDGRRER